MSSAWTCSIRFSRADSGSAPGWAKTITPSRIAMIVGIDRMSNLAPNSCWASVSTLPKVISGCFSEDRS